MDISSIKINEDRKTGLYFVRHSEAGHRFCYHRKNSAATVLRPSPEIDDLLSRSRIVHLSGISIAIAQPELGTLDHILDQIDKSDTLLSFDLNFRPALWAPEVARKQVERAVKAADIFLPGMDDIKMLYGIADPDRAVDFCLQNGLKLIVLKNGKNEIIVADGVNRTRITPPKVMSVDATGAGDCFDGTFLAYIAKGINAIEAANLAAQSAAISTTKIGAIT